MPRTLLVVTSLSGAYGGGVAAVETPADEVHLNAFPLTGGEVVLAHNAHLTAAYTVTITSVANQLGRTKNITADSIVAGATRAYGPFRPSGWKQAADGMLYLQASVGTPVVFTVTIATPGVVSKTGHGFTGGEKIVLQTTGALPTGLSANVVYFVKYIDADTFHLSLTSGGANINTTGSQSGTQTYVPAGILFTVIK